jgi:glycosyltransferase involved in cell wall biosynthesis
VAGAVRVHSFASKLADAGHEVLVVCEVPSHPAGVVLPAYRGRPMRRRRQGRLGVRYVSVRTRPAKSTRGRLALYGSYAAMATAAGALTRRPDAVLASSPPLPVGAAGALLARRHRAPLVLDVRDLWPDAAVAVGELGEGRLLTLAERLERVLYSAAAAITTTTAPFGEAIAARAPAAARISILPNGTTRLWLEAGEQPPDRAALGLDPDGFVWTYAGNVGLAQGLDAAIDAAKLLGDGFRLLIVGDGPLRERLRARSGATVEWRPLAPPDIAARQLRASDALLVSLGPSPTLAGFVPSKLFDCCALGRPVIVAAAGEARRLGELSGAGLCVPPGDPGALAAAVRRLRGDGALRRRLAAAGPAFARANRRERQAERMCTLVEELASASRRARR